MRANSKDLVINDPIGLGYERNDRQPSYEQPRVLFSSVKICVNLRFNIILTQRH